MNLPIIQSILHGSLKPNLCNLNFIELESKFEKLPDYLTKLEKLFISNFPDHKFDFDDERAICLNYISYQDYTPVNDNLIYNKLELPLPDPTSPKEGFYQSVVNAEILRVKLAIVDYSAKQQSDIDTIYEIKSTLTSIVKHIKYIDNDCDVVLSTLRTQLICFYVELSHMASSLLEQNKDYYTFKNLMYEVFNRYPTKEEMEIYNKFVEGIQEDNSNNDKSDNCEEYEDKSPITTQYDIFIDVVSNYRFFELEKVKSLNKSKQKKLIRLIVEKPTAYSVVMLQYIGYFDELKRVYRLSKEQSFEHVGKAINASKRIVKGNFNVLNPNSKEDVFTYNSRSYVDEVEKDYKNL